MTIIQYKVHQTIYELIFLYFFLDLLPVFLLTGIHLLPDCFVYLVFSVWTGIRWSVPPQISSWWWSMCLGENCLITSSNTARYSFISLLAAEQMTLTFCMCIIPYTSRNLHSDMQKKMLILVNCTCSLWYNLCLCLKTNTFYKVENIKLSVVLHTCRIKDKSDCCVTVV